MSQQNSGRITDTSTPQRVSADTLSSTNCHRYSGRIPFRRAISSRRAKLHSGSAFSAGGRAGEMCCERAQPTIRQNASHPTSPTVGFPTASHAAYSGANFHGFST